MRKKLRKRFEGLYWRQLMVTVGMVSLTLLLLGASFFSLSYNYAWNRESDEIEAKARVMGQLSVSYLESGRFLDVDSLQNASDFQKLASFGASVSDVDFMICDTQGHVLLSTDESLAGKVVTMPEDMTREILEKGSCSRRSV